MSRNKLSEIISIGSDVAGVLGLVLAVCLGIMAWHERRDAIAPVIRLGALQGNVDAPFVEGPWANTNISPSVTFTLYHDRGPDVPVQVVCLKLAVRKDTSPGWKTMGGFGEDGMFEVSDNAIQLYCWPIREDGTMVRVEERSLPFSRGGTRYYSLPAAGLLAMSRLQQTNETQFATLQVWSQGRSIGEYDVSEFVRRVQSDVWAARRAEQRPEPYRR